MSKRIESTEKMHRFWNQHAITWRKQSFFFPDSFKRMLTITILCLFKMIPYTQIPFYHAVCVCVMSLCVVTLCMFPHQHFTLLKGNLQHPNSDTQVRHWLMITTWSINRKLNTVSLFTASGQAFLFIRPSDCPDRVSQLVVHDAGFKLDVTTGQECRKPQLQQLQSQESTSVAVETGAIEQSNAISDTGFEQNYKGTQDRHVYRINFTITFTLSSEEAGEISEHGADDPGIVWDRRERRNG